jgi:putative copper resistance protein D
VLHAWGNPLHRAIKQAVRSRAAFALTYPPVVTVLFAGTIVGTHTAPVMNAVVRHGWAHDAEHAWYVMAGYMFFLVVVGSEPLRRRRSLPARFLMLVLVMPVDAVVGVALMLFAHPVYASYLERRRPWGPTVLSDQHLGGALMWMVGDAIMASLLLVIAAVFVSGADRGRARDRLDRPGTDNDARLAAYNDYLSTSS